MKTSFLTLRSSTPLVCASLLFLWLSRLDHLLGAERRMLSGRMPLAIPASSLAPVGRAEASDVLPLSIGLTPRHSDELDALLEALYDPSHPLFRHFLSPEDFANRFGPTPSDYESVIDFARAHRLQIMATHPNRLLLDVTGKVADIERSFGVKMLVYARNDGGHFYAPDVEPSVDATLPIHTVSGLNNAALPRPISSLGSSGARFSSGRSGGSGPSGSFMASDLRAAYLPGVNQTGAGQSVALIQFDNCFTNDIIAYGNRNELPVPRLKTVLLNGFDGTPGGGNPEVALDVEMVMAMAPGLDNIILYEGSISDGANSANSVLNRIATDNAARQISCSWWFPTDLTTEQIFKQYAAQGQSCFVASGDFGSWPSPFVMAVYGVTSGVTQPQDSANVTVVGGTSLKTGGPAGNWISESAWNMGFFYPQFWGSGGGYSTTVLLPSWQKGIPNSANRASFKYRNMPDVAMVAENLWTVFNNGQMTPIVGTSASAPLWAAYMALANQLAQAAGKPPIGFLNPALYRLGAGPTYRFLFHDITNGNNATGFAVSNFPAEPGYDLCTGWGTPRGSNLLYALAFPSALVISPGGDTLVSAPVGGPFTPGMMSIALSNSGSASLQWALGGVPPWLDASATSGTISPGDPATNVVLSVNSAAAQLSDGTYTADLNFTNSIDDVVQRRSLNLNIAVPPSVTLNASSTTAIAGQTVTITATVSGNFPISFQWRHAGTNLDGFISPELTLTNLSNAEDGDYSVAVTNEFGGLLSTAVSLAVTPAVAPGVLFETLYSFTGGANGAAPMGLTLGTDGNLYGCTYSGGLNNYGSVFRISADGRFKSMVSLPFGSLPLDGLTTAVDGRLLGVTYAGGFAGQAGQGVIFSIATNGTFHTLFTLTGGAIGGYPAATPTLGADGNYYGVTTTGGDTKLQSGAIYRMTPAGKYSIVHALGEGEGAGLIGRLTTGTDGSLYGYTTGAGVSPNDGTLFRVTTNGVFTTLVKWHGTFGFSPVTPPVEGNDGNFYGFASGGEAGLGIAYRMSPAGEITIIHTFGGHDDGSLSGAREGGLFRGSDGNFYGTVGGRAGSGSFGNIIRLTPEGGITALASFTGNNGANPNASLVAGPDGYFYGCTASGGAYGYGTIYRLGIFPRLDVRIDAGLAVLSWPAWADNFTPQSTPDPINGPWKDVDTSLILSSGGRYSLPVKLLQNNFFYRLRQQ